MFGGTPSRNMVNLIDKGVPARFDPEGPDLLWKAKLGTQSYAGPVIAHGRVFVGTNNENPRNIRDTRKTSDGEIEPLDLAILLCLEEKSGKFLWQAVHPAAELGQMASWPRLGICSTPVVEENRVYYVSNRGKVTCADAVGVDGKTAGIVRKGFNSPTDARLLWEYDMPRELQVHIHISAACSPLIVGDIVFIVTGNGVDSGHMNLPSPEAPSFIALDKKNGKLLWKSSAPGKNILHGQWSSPTYAEINGLKQVIFPGGDGWLYSFVPETGEPIWKFDCNPKDPAHRPGVGTRNSLLGTPVIYENKVYIGTGIATALGPESGKGDFYCIAPTKRGDISRTTISGRDNDGKPLNEAPNTNSCEYWCYGGFEKDRWEERDFKFGRTVSTACIVDDIVYITEVAGYLHCLNARSGEHYWQYDTKDSILNSPYYVDGKVLVGTMAGDLFVFRHMKEHKVYDELKAAEHAKDLREARKLKRDVQKQVEEKYLISRSEFEDIIWHNMVVANGVLYVKTGRKLYAFKCGK